MEYNAYKPQMLGQEWVPIRSGQQAEFTFVPPGTIEYGTTFNLAQSRTLGDVRLYSPDLTPLHMTLATVYQTGKENSTGPMRRVIIPCNGGAVTGATGSSTGTGGSYTVAEGLAYPNDSRYVRVDIGGDSSGGTTGTNLMRAFFATNSFANQLNGKRIVAVNLLYGAQGDFKRVVDFYTPSANTFLNMTVGLSVNTAVSPSINYMQATADWTDPGVIENGLWDAPLNEAGSTNFGPIPIHRVGLGNVNAFAVVSGGTAYFPWTYSDLQRFENFAANPLAIVVNNSVSEGDSAGFANAGYFYYYLALEVIYCEENRVAVGSVQGSGGYPETEVIQIRGTDKTASPVLTAGLYTVTVASASYSDLTFTLSGVPFAGRTARELYPIPTFDSLRVLVPNPYDDTIDGKVFEVERSLEVPQISVHTSSATLTEPHSYGVQAAAQVYTNVTATQEILDTSVGPARSYQQVRYYARRFGDTSTPLKLSSASPSVSGTGMQVFLTPAQHDALPEITDGWKEVTLRFDTAPTMGNSANPQWVWSAVGELPGNRWEVIGAVAPSISGQGGNPLLQVITANRLYTATYGAPNSGSTINLGWVPGFFPTVSSTTDDSSADAVLIFSADPQIPSGLTVSPLSQALAMADPDCPVNPACIPSALGYHLVSWTPISGASFEDFNGIAVSGWGTTNSGQAWTVSAPTAYAATNGSEGSLTFPNTGSSTMTATMDIQSVDAEARITFWADKLSANDMQTELQIRRTDANNNYRAAVELHSDQTVNLRISKTVASVSTDLLEITIPGLTWAANKRFHLVFRAAGTLLAAKVWDDYSEEPNAWHIILTDTSLTTGTLFAVTAQANPAASEVPITWYFDDLLVQPPDFGALELQRYDPVDGEFNTIMLCTNAGITGFSDYEARVDQQSVYRMRTRNAYDFASLWGPQVTGTLASPGVTGASVGLLIFTSNFHQDGSLNLAYSAEWEGGQPIEQFQWAEAGQVQLQMMYGKDFPTAFHPLERAGEAFSRDILVNAAGIPPVVSEHGFRYLRDMAWDSAPYICVRDELGNRWYATVLVPQGSQRRMVARGHLDVAQVNVVQTTDTPYPVDPA